MLKYLRQQYNIILMYINWVKPHMKNLRRLTPDMQKSDTPDIVGAFEGSIVEVEFLGRQLPDGNSKYHAVVLVHLEHRTRPELKFQAEGFQRGPVHAGRVTVSFRSYAWTNHDVENYIKMREEENLELLQLADGTLKAAMDALGDDLKRYLIEEGEKFKEGKEEEIKLTSPFGSLIGGFADLFGAFVPKKDKAKTMPSLRITQERDAAAKAARKSLWNLYKFYKKAHKMITW